MAAPWGQPVYGWTPPPTYYSPGYWQYVPVQQYPIHQSAFPTPSQQPQGRPAARDLRLPQRLPQRQLPQRRELQLHRFLGGLRRPTALWDVSHGPLNARRLTSRESVEPVTRHFLDQPATDPPVTRMRIVCDSFQWDVNIHIPPRDRQKFISIGIVLDSIYGTLHERLDPEDWHDICPTDRRKIYKAMLTRLRKSRPSMMADGYVLRIDCLLDKTVFLGLRPGGPNPNEWMLLLGPPRR